MLLALESLCTSDVDHPRRIWDFPEILLNNQDPSTDLALVNSLQSSTTHFSVSTAQLSCPEELKVS